MDLSSLYSTLPPEQLQQAEKEMMDNFRQAALSITHLYKASMHTSKQAYSAGYSACLSDILQTVQASLSASSIQSPSISSTNFDTSHSFHPDDPSIASSSTSRPNAQPHSHTSAEATASAAAARTLGRLMDWVEARQEALRIEAEEEEREREKERERDPTANGGFGNVEGATTQKGSGNTGQGQARTSIRPMGPLRSRSRSNQPAVRFEGRPGMKVDQDDELDPDQDPMSLSIASLPGTNTRVDQLSIPVSSSADILVSPTLTAPTPTPQYRQRDALVQAVQRATAARSQSPRSGAGSESSNTPNPDRQRQTTSEIPSSPPLPAFTPQQQQARQQEEFASSPMNDPSPTPTPAQQSFRPTATAAVLGPAGTLNAAVRPLRPLQYHRSKSGASHSHPRKDKDHHLYHQNLRGAALTESKLEDENGIPIFAPLLSGALPPFPVFTGAAVPPATDVRVQDYSVGSKRPHDVSSNPTGNGAVPLDRTGTGRSGGGRKRGHGTAKAQQMGAGWDVDMDGSGGGVGNDERERKRVARR